MVLRLTSYPHLCGFWLANLASFFSFFFLFLFNRRVNEDSILTVQVFDHKKFKKKDQGFLGVINVRIGDAIDLVNGEDGMAIPILTFPLFPFSPPPSCGSGFTDSPPYLLPFRIDPARTQKIQRQCCRTRKAIDQS